MVFMKGILHAYKNQNLFNFTTFFIKMQEKQVIFLKESGIIFLDLSLLYGRGAEMP